MNFFENGHFVIFTIVECRRFVTWRFKTRRFRSFETRRFESLPFVGVPISVYPGCRFLIFTHTGIRIRNLNLNRNLLKSRNRNRNINFVHSHFTINFMKFINFFLLKVLTKWKFVLYLLCSFTGMTWQRSLFDVVGVQTAFPSQNEWRSCWIQMFWKSR
jgi:hypothetical protein